MLMKALLKNKMEINEIRDKYRLSEETAKYLSKIKTEIKSDAEMGINEFFEIQKSLLKLRCLGEEYQRAENCLGAILGIKNDNKIL